MKSTVVSTWGLPVSVALAACGAGAAWLGSSAGSGPLAQASWLVGVILCALAIATVVWTSTARVRRDEKQRKLSRYGCPKCGYTPDVGDIESKDSMPCPICGRQLYEH